MKTLAILLPSTALVCSLIQQAWATLAPYICQLLTHFGKVCQ